MNRGINRGLNPSRLLFASPYDIDFQPDSSSAPNVVVSGGGNDAGIPLTVAGNSSTQTGNLLSVLQNPGGNPLLTVATASTATNGVTITGTATAGAPTVAATGTDTNIGLGITPKGTGTVTITGGATTSPGTALTVAGVNSATSGITITNSGSATGPSLVVAGSATNAGLTIRVKGAGSLLIGDVGTGSIQIGGDSNVGNITIGGNTGNNITIGNPNSTSAVTFQTGTGKLLQLLIGGSTGLTVTGPASSVNGATFTCSASLSAPSLAATGSDTNIDLILNSKGTGVVNLGPASAAAAISGSVGPATLATTTGGATGPATATQNQWLKIKVNGTVNYIPTWV